MTTTPQHKTVQKQTMDARGTGKATLNGNTRTTGLEQYYTPQETANQLTKLATTLIPNWQQRTWIDPAAGTGTFTTAAQNIGIKNIHAYDIDPKTPQTTQANYLSLQLSIPEAVCITNPPFGRNNSLSVPFFNKLATDGCHYIGFIIPKSWRKWTIQNRLHPNYHLIHDEELTIDYVDHNGEHVSQQKGGLKTIFQLWEHRTETRQKTTIEDRNYITRTTPQEADISLTIFGRGCGTVRTEFDRTRKNTTQMYLKSRTQLSNTHYNTQTSHNTTTTSHT